MPHEARIIYPSAARTAAPTVDTQVNRGHRGMHLIVDATSITSTPSITVKIQGIETLSGKTYDILVSSAITTVSTTVLKVYPGLTAAANSVANDVLPVNFRVAIEHGDSDSITYSAVALLIP